MILHFKIAGGLLVLLGMVHVGFPRYFLWRKDFAAVSPINREMMYYHTFFLALIVLLMGVLCLISAEDLARTRLGHEMDLGLALFWMIRLLVQFFGYSTVLWRGKRFERLTHALFSILWVYLTAVFLVASGLFAN